MTKRLNSCGALGLVNSDTPVYAKRGEEKLQILPTAFVYFPSEELNANDGKEVVDYHEKDSYREHLGS